MKTTTHTSNEINGTNSNKKQQQNKKQSYYLIFDLIGTFGLQICNLISFYSLIIYDYQSKVVSLLINYTFIALTIALLIIKSLNQGKIQFGEFTLLINLNKFVMIIIAILSLLTSYVFGYLLIWKKIPQNFNFIVIINFIILFVILLILLVITCIQIWQTQNIRKINIQNELLQVIETQKKKSTFKQIELYNLNFQRQQPDEGKNTQYQNVNNKNNIISSFHSNNENINEGLNNNNNDNGIEPLNKILKCIFKIKYNNDQIQSFLQNTFQNLEIKQEINYKEFIIQINYLFQIKILLFYIKLVIILMILTAQMMFALNIEFIYFFIKYHKYLFLLGCFLYPILIGTIKYITIKIGKHIHMNQFIQDLSLIYAALPYRLIFFNNIPIQLGIFVILIKFSYKIFAYYLFPSYLINWTLELKQNLKYKLKKNMRNSKSIEEQKFKFYKELKERFNVIQLVDIFNIIIILIIVAIYKYIVHKIQKINNSRTINMYQMQDYNKLSIISLIELALETIILIIVPKLIRMKVNFFKKHSMIFSVRDYMKQIIFMIIVYQNIFVVSFIIINCFK